PTAGGLLLHVAQLRTCCCVHLSQSATQIKKYIWSPVRPGTENPLLLPKMAIDAFTTIYSQKLRILPNLPLYQLYVQKYSVAGGI
ncbi:MAG: hypothetical protein ACOVLK_04125, partial [Terrimicrobiaceae bacterium]